MATQASAITFVSTTGQGYADGMRFVQFYFGLPIAMVVLSIVAVPIFHRLNVFTAYEYLEQRFDLKTRVFTALLFLVQRSLSTGLSLYASGIILSVVMGWDMTWTMRIIGLAIIVYTTIGGVKGVNWNDFQQFLIIAAGMTAACVVTVRMLPQEVSFLDAVSIAGTMGKLNTVDYSFDWENRYNFWSGLIGGAFLALSYFGTDQSQVQRYLTGKSVAQSRLGLLFNGLAKVPMQFGILFVGVMVFVFYQFVPPPLFFNPEEVRKLEASGYAEQYQGIESRYREAAERQEQNARSWVASRGTPGEEAARKRLQESGPKLDALRKDATELMRRNDPESNTSDTNYVFLSFVLQHLPHGLVGLVIVVVFAATMSSSASAMNSLATTTVIDVYKRLVKKDAGDRHYLLVTRISTVFWGAFAVLLSERASRLGSLIEAVNILGSLFYGAVLGIFLLAFFAKHVRGTAAFAAAIAGEVLVLYLFLFTKISFLWYNVFGCLAVIAVALLIQAATPSRARSTLP
jgi:Na+/proline symporter